MIHEHICQRCSLPVKEWEPGEWKHVSIARRKSCGRQAVPVVNPLDDRPDAAIVPMRWY